MLLPMRCLLPRYVFRASHPPSASARNRVWRHLGLRVGTAHPRLRCGFKATTGRGSAGTRTVFSKAARAAHPTHLQLHRRATWLHRLALLIDIVPRGYGRGLANLLCTSGGG
jgi:hypothetical protein